MACSPVRMLVEWHVPAGQAPPIAAAVQSVMMTTREQRGCLGCTLSTDARERFTLHYEESWATEQDLKRQLISERFSELAGLIESATEAPRIEFALPAGTRGLEYVVEVRRAAAVSP